MLLQVASSIHRVAAPSLLQRGGKAADADLPVKDTRPRTVVAILEGFLTYVISSLNLLAQGKVRMEMITSDQINPVDCDRDQG